MHLCLKMKRIIDLIQPLLVRIWLNKKDLFSTYEAIKILEQNPIEWDVHPSFQYIVRGDY